MNKIEFFQSLGMTEYEAKVLSSLVKLKNITPKEISFDSSVPQNKLYQILKKFESYGILSRIPSDIKKYKLINLKTFINEKVSEKKNQLKELEKSSKNLEIPEDREEQFIFSLIKGQRAIMNKLAEKNIDVKKEILGVQRNWKYWAEGIRAMQQSIKRGIDVKIIGVINPETKSRASEWKKAGCKIKAYNDKFGKFPLRFTIFDNKEARITIGKPEIPNPEDYITIWTNSKPLIAILKKQFFEMWRVSRKF